MTHGTISCYTNHACRCEQCSLAMSTYERAYRRKNPGMKPSQKARQHAVRAAADWVRSHHPAVWERVYEDACILHNVKRLDHPPADLPERLASEPNLA